MVHTCAIRALTGRHWFTVVAAVLHCAGLCNGSGMTGIGGGWQTAATGPCFWMLLSVPASGLVRVLFGI